MDVVDILPSAPESINLVVEFLQFQIRILEATGALGASEIDFCLNFKECSYDGLDREHTEVKNKSVALGHFSGKGHGIRMGVSPQRLNLLCEVIDIMLRFLHLLIRRMVIVRSEEHTS